MAKRAWAHKVRLSDFRLVVILLFPIYTQAANLDEESTQLAYCSGVMAYAANLLLLQKNPDAARILIVQGGRASASLFFSNAKNGVLTQTDLTAFREATRTAKPFLDANPDAIDLELTACTQIVDMAAKREADRNIRVLGKTFYEVVNEMSWQALRAYGL